MTNQMPASHIHQANDAHGRTLVCLRLIGITRHYFMKIIFLTCTKFPPANRPIPVACSTMEVVRIASQPKG